MRRLRHGELDSIIDEFLGLPGPLALVEVEGVEPHHLKKQLARRIEKRGFKTVMSVTVLGNTVQLKHSQRSLGTQEDNRLIFRKIPTIKR